MLQKFLKSAALGLCAIATTSLMSQSALKAANADCKALVQQCINTKSCEALKGISTAVFNKCDGSTAKSRNDYTDACKMSCHDGRLQKTAKHPGDCSTPCYEGDTDAL